VQFAIDRSLGVERSESPRFKGANVRKLFRSAFQLIAKGVQVHIQSLSMSLVPSRSVLPIAIDVEQSATHECKSVHRDLAGMERVCLRIEISESIPPSQNSI
jgi:hypothetical protein